jgi:transcriptional regulator with XRE-family HTH domain
MVFAENLRRRRLEQFLSQAELARRAGLHALTITRLEAGTSAPSTRTVRALAEVLGLEPRDLATPREVAELRRVLGRPAPPRGDGGSRQDGRSDKRAAANPDVSSQADED